MKTCTLLLALLLYTVVARAQLTPVPTDSVEVNDTAVAGVKVDTVKVQNPVPGSRIDTIDFPCANPPRGRCQVLMHSWPGQSNGEIMVSVNCGSQSKTIIYTGFPAGTFTFCVTYDPTKPLLCCDVKVIEKFPDPPMPELPQGRNIRTQEFRGINFPNPFTGKTNLVFYSDEEGSAVLVLQNETGAVVKKAVIPVVRGTNTVTIDGAGLLPGTFFTRVVMQHKVEVFKITHLADR